MKPLISIITPTFNRANFIPEAIESVLNQTYSNFEMIIIDDGSIDNTSQIIKNYLSDSRLQYHYQNNYGQSVARNSGISKSCGDYICFLDSDNIWFPDKLEKSISAFETTSHADIVYGDIVIINEHGLELTRDNIRRHSGKITRYLLRDNCVSMNTTMVRKKCFDKLGGMNESCRVADDYELWLRLSTEYSFHYIDEYLAYYRVMTDQISSDKTKRLASNQQILEDFFNRFPDAVSKNIYREGWCYFFSRKGRYYADNKDLKLAFSSYVEAIRHQPFNIIPWRGMLRLFAKNMSHLT